MLLIQCFYLLLKIKNGSKLVKMQQNVTIKIFWTEGDPPLDAFGVSMSLPKTNSLSTILDPPL